MFRTSSTAEQRRVTAAAGRSSLLSRVGQDPSTGPRVEQLLSRYGRTLQFDAGDVVCRKGDFGNAVYFLTEGTLCEVVQDENEVVSVPPPPSTISADPRRRFWNFFRKPPEEDIFVVDVNYRQSIDNMEEVLERCEIRRFRASAPAESGEPPGGVAGESLFGAVPALTRSPFPRFVFAETPVRLLAIHWRGMQDLIRYSELAHQVVTLRCRTEIIDLFRSQAFGDSGPVPSSRASPRRAPRRARVSDDSRRRLRRDSGSSGGADQAGLCGRVGFRTGQPQHRRTEQECQLCPKGRRVRPRGDRVRRRGSTVQDVSGLPGATRASWCCPPRRLPTSASACCPRRIFLRPTPPRRKNWAAGTHVASNELRERSREARLVDFLVDHAYVRGRQAMVIDQTRCVGCDACVQACADTHRGVPRFVRAGPSAGGYAVANACMHCEEAPCLVNCPTDAIFRKHSAEVVVSEVLCIGCGACADACPYDNIRLVELGASPDEMERSTPLALKCDLCIDQKAGPACVRACPHDAIARVDLTSHEVVPQLAAAVNLRDLAEPTR